MIIDYSEFIKYFPEFSALTEAQITFQLELSADLLSEKRWGKHYQRAVFLYTAHDLSTRYSQLLPDLNPSVGVGIVNNRSAGNSNLSEGLSLPAFVTGDDPLLAALGRTRYGIDYLVLMNMVFGPGYLV